MNVIGVLRQCQHLQRTGYHIANVLQDCNILLICFKESGRKSASFEFLSDFVLQSLE